MDPLTTSALASTITALLAGTAGEAGKSTWATLTSAVHRIFGSESPQAAASTAAELAVTGQDSADQTAVNVAAAQLLAGAERDPAFAALLRDWHTDAAAVVQGSHSTTNVVSGNARVHALNQGRDVQGNINFG